MSLKALLLALALLLPACTGEQPVAGAVCPATLRDAHPRCQAVVERSDAYAWKVSEAGRFSLTLHPLKRKVPFAAGLEVKDAAGAVVATGSSADVGQDVVLSLDAQPGSYALRVFPADDFKVKGGYAYELELARPDAGVAK